MNGKFGVATDFHTAQNLSTDMQQAPTWHAEPESYRYTVKFDSGEVFKLRPVNVRAEGVGGGGGGGRGVGAGGGGVEAKAKASPKGKGKKARGGRK